MHEAYGPVQRPARMGYLWDTPSHPDSVNIHVPALVSPSCLRRVPASLELGCLLGIEAMALM